MAKISAHLFALIQHAVKILMSLPRHEGLNFNFSNHKIELSRLNLTPRSGKILTLAAVKIPSAATAPNCHALNFRYRDYAHELALFELFDLERRDEQDAIVV